MVRQTSRGTGLEAYSTLWLIGGNRPPHIKGPSEAWLRQIWRRYDTGSARLLHLLHWEQIEHFLRLIVFIDPT
jgi:hypothetical protein